MKTICAALAATMLVASPAHAVTFQFFEHNGCTGKKLGSVDSDNLGAADTLSVWIDRGYGAGWNDEARSVRITSNWRHVSDIRRISLAVYDSKDTTRKTNDDWARVVVRDVTMIPVQGVCVESFERPTDGDGVYLETHPYNGLDGKVSQIILECNAACRRNVTAVPTSLKTKIGTSRN